MEDRISRQARVKGKRNAARKGRQQLGPVSSPDPFPKVLCPEPMCPRWGREGEECSHQLPSSCTLGVYISPERIHASCMSGVTETEVKGTVPHGAEAESHHYATPTLLDDATQKTGPNIRGHPCSAALSNIQVRGGNRQRSPNTNRCLLIILQKT